LVTERHDEFEGWLHLQTNKKEQANENQDEFEGWVQSGRLKRLAWVRFLSMNPKREKGERQMKTKTNVKAGCRKAGGEQ
jgi:hypothetical protein